MTLWFRNMFTWWLGHFIPCLHENWMLTKPSWQKLRMHYLFQSTCKPISHRNEWSFSVYMIPLRNLIPEWNSRPGARTGVNSHRHDILWWYHVNNCRAMRGKRSELAPARKSPQCHVNTLSQDVSWCLFYIFTIASHNQSLCGFLVTKSRLRLATESNLSIHRTCIT